jgi:hypothetical protein
VNQVACEPVTGFEWHDRLMMIFSHKHPRGKWW